MSDEKIECNIGYAKTLSGLVNIAVLVLFLTQFYIGTLASIFSHFQIENILNEKKSQMSKNTMKTD